MKSWMFIDVIKIKVSSGLICVQNLFHNTSMLLEQPLLLYIIVTGVWSEYNICVCYLCTGNWCIVIVFVMCENTDITWFDVLLVDCHIVVSLSLSVALCWCRNPGACNNSCIAVPCHTHPLRWRFSCWRCEKLKIRD